MSDTNSDNSSSRRPNHRSLDDFPLFPTATTAAVPRAIRVPTLPHTNMFHPGSTLDPRSLPIRSFSHIMQSHGGLMSQAPRQSQRSAGQANASTEPKKPSVTLVRALSATTFKDEDSKTPKTFGLLKAQAAALRYLERYASDQLTPHTAYLLTLSIDRDHNTPSPEEALRLCYYMRSQGYDVYPELCDANKTMTLYIVNQKSHERGKEHDFPYWKQNFATEVVQNIFEMMPNISRRNALTFNLPSNEDMPPTPQAPRGNSLLVSIHQDGGDGEQTEVSSHSPLSQR